MREDAQFSSHGVRCSAWVYRPDAPSGEPAGPAPATPAPATPAPAIVMAHGFGCIRDLRLPAYAERFRDAGFVVVVFDYRHFGASDGQPRQLLDIGRQLDDWRMLLWMSSGFGEVGGGRCLGGGVASL